MEEGLRIVNTVDNSQLERELRKSRRTIMGVAEAAESAGARIDAAFRRLSKASSANLDASFERVRKMVSELHRISSEGIDLSNPEKELAKFDEQVVEISKHLDGYFESLKEKLHELLGVMGASKSMTSSVPTNDNNIAQIEQIKRQNEELEEQIKRQTEEIARQQEQWRKLAEAVRTNNVSAIQKLSQETDEATKRIKLDSLKGSLKALGGEMDDFAERMAKASGDAEALKLELDSLREQGAGEEQIASTETAYQKAVEELEKLKAEYNSMSEEQRKYIDQLNEAEGHHVRMRTQIMDAREQLIKMIQAGQTGTPEFQELAEKAGEMRKELAMASALMQYYGTPNSHLAALKQGLQGVAGAAGVAIGLMGIFNEKSEKMAEIQTKLQSILGIIIGLETTFNAVKKTSNVLIAVSEFQTWALARAKKAEASATALATVRQAAYNLVAKANPYVLLASVIGALVVGIYKLVTANEEATDSEKARQREIEKTRKAEEHRLQTIGKHTGDLVAKYMSLQRQWAQLKTTGEKTKWLDENIRKFKELTGGVKNMADAEKYLVELAPQVIAALKSVAEAEAYEELYKEAVKKRATNWEQRIKSKKTGDYYVKEKGGSYVSTTTGLPKEWINAGVTSEDYESRMSSMVSTEAKLTKSGIDKVNRYRRDQAIKTRIEMEEQYDKEVNAYGDMYDEKLRLAQEANAKLGKFGAGGGGGNGDGKNDKVLLNGDKYDELLRKQTLAQSRAVKDMELATEQARIDAMDEGTRKTIRQLQLNYEKTYEEIDREYEDLKRKKIENAKALWEANPENAGKPFDESSVDTTYTKEEKAHYIARLEANEKALKESLRRLQQTERDYQIENLRNYGDFEGKKQALVLVAEKIRQDAAEERLKFIRQYGSLDEIDKAESLMLELNVNDDAGERQKIEQQVREITESIAGTDAAKVNLLVAIDNKEKASAAKAVFDAFKQSDEYERFFTRIDTLTMKNAISIKNTIRQNIISAFKDGALTVDEFKKELQALDEQFDRLENSSDKLMTYLKSGFDGLIEKAKETGREVQAIGASILKNGKIDDKDKSYLESLGKIFNTGDGKVGIGSLMSKFGSDWKSIGAAVSEGGANMEAGASNFSSAIAIIDTIIKNLHGMVQGIGSIIDEMDYGRNEDAKISDSLWESFQRFDNHINSSWENLKNGNFLGAITETVAGIVSWVSGDLLDANEKINDQIKESAREVTKLQTAYRSLERAIDSAYGAGRIGAEQVALENKKLQLVELQRQLSLEESRDSKYRDEDAILSLKDQVEELRIEIEDFTEDITNNFLGISSASDAVSNMVDVIVDALRNGEDAISSFGDTINDMIANMIKQVVASKIIGPMFDNVWNDIEADINNRANNLNFSDVWSKIIAGEITDVNEYLQKTLGIAIFEGEKTLAQKIQELEEDLNSQRLSHGNTMFYKYADPSMGTDIMKNNSYFWDWYFNPDNEYFQKMGNAGKYIEVSFEEWAAQQQAMIDALRSYLEDASTPTYEDIRTYAQKLRDIAPEIEPFIDELDALLNELGLNNKEYTQEATAKAFQTMRQDTADELNGRFTAIQVGVFDIRDMVSQILEQKQGGGVITIVDAIQTAIATSNIHLSAISKNTKDVLAFGEILEEIRDNIKKL